MPPALFASISADGVKIKTEKKMKKSQKKKPVVLITGYLGSGKTTLLNNLLRQEKRQVALIVNDMGSINVDAEILKKQGAAVAQAAMYELQNGCICCTLRDEFIEQMEKISQANTAQAVFVEASGISDPGAIAASFLAYEDENPDTNVYLSSIITVVDADRIHREFLTNLEKYRSDRSGETDENGLGAQDITTLIVDQIEFCNRIVLNKCDLLDEEKIAAVEKVIRDFQPKAPIMRAVNGTVEPDDILTDEPFDFEQVDSSSAIQKAINSLNGTKGCTDEYGISSFVFEERRPFNREKFMSFLRERYPEQLIRAKGYIWFSDADADVQLFEQAGRNSSVTEVSYWIDALSDEQKKAVLEENPDVRENWDAEFGDRENQIVFIGKGYDREAIRSALLGCLDGKESA